MFMLLGHYNCSLFCVIGRHPAAAMAEAGAHLTSAAVREQPSIFEVLAQESLMEAVKPALRHAVKVSPPVSCLSNPRLVFCSLVKGQNYEDGDFVAVESAKTRLSDLEASQSTVTLPQVLAESNPSHFAFLWRHFDELYLLLDLVLQNHFLSHCSASFSENFYGLKRVPAGRGLSIGLGLRRSSHWRSLVLLCLVPYLRAKLEGTLARQRDEEDFSIRLSQTRIQRLYRAAVAAYPYVGSAWQVLVFCQHLLFVFGVSRTHDPLLWLARVRLARLTAKDVRDMELRSSEIGNPPKSRCVSCLVNQLFLFFSSSCMPPVQEVPKVKKNTHWHLCLTVTYQE